MATFYIDPVAGSNSNDGLSDTTPKATIPTITSNNTYLLKRDTTYTSSVVVPSSVVGVSIGAYGTGSRPIVNPGSSGRWSVRVSVGCTNTTITDLECTGARGNGSQTCFGIYIGSGTGSVSSNVFVRNCYVHHIIGNTSGDCNGIMGFGNDIEVSNCVITGIPDDGIWIEGLRAKVLYNNISDVGTGSSATGDCVQLNGETASSSCGEFQIIGNYLNHEKNLEKQCFIVSSASLGFGGLFAQNICIFPLDPISSGNACYYSDQPGAKCIGNYFFGGTYGVLIDAGANQVVRSNVFVQNRYGLTVANAPLGLLVDNNTFLNTTSGGIYNPTNDSTSKIRQNVFYQCGAAVASYGTIVKATNCYYGNTQYNWSTLGGGGTIEGDALLVDPLLEQQFMPKSNSPLRGVGVFLGYNTDFNNVQFKNPPSIGAYEYVSPRGGAGTRGTR